MLYAVGLTLSVAVVEAARVDFQVDRALDAAEEGVVVPLVVGRMTIARGGSRSMSAPAVIRSQVALRMAVPSSSASLLGF